MDWIFDNLQIVVLVLIGLASVIKSMLDAKAAKSAENDEPPSREEDYDPDAEARQPPAGPSVPPPLSWDDGPTPLREVGYEAAVASEAAKVLKHQQNLAQRLQQIRDTKATTTGGAAATRARVDRKGAAKPTAKVPLSIRARLKNPAEVRRAFVMREILDPPIGLR